MDKDEEVISYNQKIILYSIYTSIYTRSIHIDQHIEYYILTHIGVNAVVSLIWKEKGTEVFQVEKVLREEEYFDQKNSSRLCLGVKRKV